MYFLHARGFACVCRAVLGLAAISSVVSAQDPPQLNPGQVPVSTPARAQPGNVGATSASPLQAVPATPQTSEQSGVQPDRNEPPPIPLVFESHGLEYDALTKNGITVMFAQLPSRLKEFSIVQITVTNGSLVSWTVKPDEFVFVRPDGTTLAAVSADYVVAELLSRADRDDVIKLQLLYENSISGLANYRPTNGYEKRREAAMAQFVNRGFKAAAEASAIAFVPTKLKNGDSTDGAIFFPNRSKERSLGAGRLIAHTCGETFIFETYAELKKRQ
jgi:hypothetical protein